MFWIIILCFVVLVGLVIVIYMMPTETAKSKKKEKKQALLPDPIALDKTKDWKAIAERWEKNNNALLGDLEKIKMHERTIAKQIEDMKAQHKDALEKLALEKSWREKEQTTLEKNKHHEQSLKDQIVHTEKDLEKEHSSRIRLERDLQELKIKHDEIVEAKREISVKATSLDTSLAAANKELKELKSENAKLKEKRADIQWVAKSEFDELKKELDRLKQSNT